MEYAIQKTMMVSSLMLFSVTSPASVLGDLAASMSPGTWAELNTEGFDEGTLLFTTDDQPGNTTYGRRIIDYAESAAWDPVSRQFFFVGGPHAYGWKFIIYKEETNTWREGPLPFDCQNYGFKSGKGCAGHGFDLNTINVAKGEFVWRYRKLAPEVMKFDISNETWSRFPMPPSNILSTWDAVNNQYGALEWFPERNGFFSVVGTRMFFYTESTDTWEKLSGVSLGNYHNFAEYSPVHKVMLFGGGNSGVPQNQELYKMDVDGSITKLNDAPGGAKIRITADSSSSNGTLIKSDPVSGKYIVLTINKKLYEYDVVSDIWKQLSDPPITSHAIATAIPEHGVIMYVSGDVIYLYKHEDCSSCAPLVPASTPGGLILEKTQN